MLNFSFKRHLYLRTFEHREAQKLQICDDNDAVNLEFISKYFQCTMRYFTGKMPYTHHPNIKTFFLSHTINT